MYIAKVIGNVVSATKCEKLTGLKLLLVQQIDMLTMKKSGAPVVISDSVGAGVGEVVMVVTGGSARLTDATTGKPVDATIIGIIDTIEIEGKMLFQKYPPKEESSTTPKCDPETITESASESTLEINHDTATDSVGKTEIDQIPERVGERNLEPVTGKKIEQKTVETKSQRAPKKNKQFNHFE